jgi:hypothetical protein
MKLNEINVTQAHAMGILPAWSRAQKLLRMKAEIESLVAAQNFACAEEMQRQYACESGDAREGLGSAWDRFSLAITLGWNLPESAIAAMATACAENAKKMPKIFAE